MSDAADITDLKIEEAISDKIGVAARAVASMPQGEPGECSGCGEFSMRLVDSYCAPCRDKYARFFK